MFGFVALYFLRRWYLRRRPESALIALLAIGWIFFDVLAVGWLGATAVLLTMALSSLFGALFVLVLVDELRRAKMRNAGKPG